MKRPKTVLVVDDDETSRQAFAMIVQSWGVDVITAKDGKEALSVVKEKKPNLLLLDVKMPEIDGFNVCRILKKNLFTKKIPIILLTGLGELENIKKGYHYGADDYYVKPVKWDQVKFKILKLLKIKF